MKYILFFLLSACGSMVAEKYSIKEYISALADKRNLILSTVSGDKGVDCGIFSIEGNNPQLHLSTHIKNEEITTFSDAIKSLLSQLNESYGISVQYGCFAG